MKIISLAVSLSYGGEIRKKKKRKKKEKEEKTTQQNMLVGGQKTELFSWSWPFSSSA